MTIDNPNQRMEDQMRHERHFDIGNNLASTKVLGYSFNTDRPCSNIRPNSNSLDTDKTTSAPTSTDKMGENSMTQNRSMLRDFLGSIGTMRGDLSSITAPPFVLDTKSAVELPQYWSDVPSNFIAPALEQTPERRALSVLRWFLGSLRNQQYAGHSEKEGVKKPLNAFLGELFLGHWDDDCGTTYLVSEQVSHHPPVTACRAWNEKHGVSAEGYTRQEITFNGSVSIKQIGHAILTLSHHNESYLIPLPSVKVKGLLTGHPYPELDGTYHITSTNGYTSVIDFTGRGFFSGKKNSVHAELYHGNDSHNPLYTISGTWNEQFTIHDVRANSDIETFSIHAQRQSPLIVPPLDEQDPWETRRAWRDVRDALNRGDMPGTAAAKNVLEEGQRGMRSQQGLDPKTWRRAFFVDAGRDEVFSQLAALAGISDKEDTLGVWKFRQDAWDGGITKPFHGGLTPDNNGHGRRPSQEQDTGPVMETDAGYGRSSTDSGHGRTSMDSGYGRTSTDGGNGMKTDGNAVAAASIGRDMHQKHQQGQHTSTPVSGAAPAQTSEPQQQKLENARQAIEQARRQGNLQHTPVHTNGVHLNSHDRQTDINRTQVNQKPMGAHQKNQQSSGANMGEQENSPVASDSQIASDSQVEDFLRSKYSSSGR